MSKRSTLKIAVSVVVLVLMSFAMLYSSGLQQADAKVIASLQNACTSVTDDDLIKTINENFAADVQLKDQMRHLNVSVTKRVVTLEGWLDGRATVNKAIALAKKARCVRRVVSKLKTQGGGSCGPGQKPCGDVCVDKASRCTINQTN